MARTKYTPTTKIENQLQKEIVSQALDWLYKKQPGEDWEEISKNRGEMLNTLKKEFGFKAGAEAWCAMFGWGIVDQACKVVGAKNVIPKTAGALDLLRKCEKTNVVIVDDEPEIGAIMYRKSGEKTATGHIGIVVKVEKDAFWTIEGNVDDKVGMVKYTASKDTAPRYFANGGQMYFMWAGRMPHTGKARDVKVDLVTKRVEDTTRTGYVIGKPSSDLDLPRKVKPKKLRGRAWR
jgi:hypothetical protein